MKEQFNNKEEVKMKQLTNIIIIALLGLCFTTGCEKDSSSALTDEQLEEQAIIEMITSEESEESDYMADWGIDDGSENNMFDGFSSFSPGISFPKVMAPIDKVIRFGRKLNRNIPRTLILRRVSQDSIFVYTERVWLGQFVIFQNLNQDETQPVSVNIYRKPLRHVVKKTAVFTLRTEDENDLKDPRRRWKLAAISLNEGFSHPVVTIEIHQVTIELGGGNLYTFTDPSELLNIRDEIPIAMHGERVKITVLVSNSTENPISLSEPGETETLLLHYGINRFHHARKRFQYEGIDEETNYNIYEGEWTVHEPAFRPFHCCIDAIDNGTIFDDDNETYPYNSATWGFPYRVVLSK